MTTQRTRKRRFSRTHIVITRKVTSNHTEYLQRKASGEKIAYIHKKLHHVLNGGRPTYSHRERK